MEHYVIAAEWRQSSIWLHSLIVLIMPLLVVDFAIGSMFTRNLKAMQWLRIIRRLQWNLQTTLEARAFRLRCTTACKLNKRSTARLYCSCSAHWDFLLDKDFLYEATPVVITTSCLSYEQLTPVHCRSLWHPVRKISGSATIFKMRCWKAFQTLFYVNCRVTHVHMSFSHWLSTNHRYFNIWTSELVH